jgi:type II secretory ATPase GspE/PulE/Tfp pilus assembly ATPase PilB-like protein
MSDQASIGSTETDADVPAMVDSLLRDAMDRGASDVHVEPVRDGYVIRIRLEGLLENVEHLDGNTGRALVMRLMVMGNLLTYHMDVPQEGRATATGPDDRSVDVRLAVMPTIHGPRATVRLPGAIQAPQNLGDLGLSEPTTAFLRDFAEADFGCLLLTGPAGCGKTTTIYALLRHLVENQPGMSIISLEDPVEADLTGVTQIQVMSFGDLTYERAIRSILRQDPQVLVIGEIRDPAGSRDCWKWGSNLTRSPARCSAWPRSDCCGARPRKATAGGCRSPRWRGWMRSCARWCCSAPMRGDWPRPWPTSRTIARWPMRPGNW